MSEIKAIETRYNGYRFRSRLEARWAVFFDVAGIVWEYEKEGFELSIGRYLPDFWLPNVGVRGGPGGTWVEIKPVAPSVREIDLVWELCGGSDEQDAALPSGQGVVLVGPVSNDLCGQHLQIAPWRDDCMVFMKCSLCRHVKIEFSECSYMHCPRCKKPADNEHPDLIRAVQAARSARFEFGEKGGFR